MKSFINYDKVIKTHAGDKMILNKESQCVKSYTFSITREEARKIRQQKIINNMPTLENRLRRAKRNTRLRAIKERNKEKYDNLGSASKVSPKY